jgi:hypothetical protein
MIKRVIAGLILFGSVVLFPFWVTAILSLVFVVYFEWYLEVVFVALYMDMLFAPGSIAGVYSSTNTTGALLILVVMQFLKTRLRFYDAKSF